MSNGKLAKARAYAKIVAGLVVLGLFVYLVVTGQVDKDFTQGIIRLIFGLYLFGDGVAKASQQ